MPLRDPIFIILSLSTVLHMIAGSLQAARPRRRAGRTRRALSSHPRGRLRPRQRPATTPGRAHRQKWTCRPHWPRRLHILAALLVAACVPSHWAVPHASSKASCRRRAFFSLSGTRALYRYSFFALAAPLISVRGRSNLTADGRSFSNLRVSNTPTTPGQPSRSEAQS